MRRVLFVLCLLAIAASAAEIVGEVKIERASASSVLVKWRTDVETGSRVNYGAAPDALSQRAEGGVTVEHTVAVTSLKPGERYDYSVGTARKKLATGSFTMSASPSSVPKITPDTSPDRSPPAPAKSSSVTKPTPAQKAPPARVTWGNFPSLADHFTRHGGDFRARDAEDYAAQAWAFRQRAYASSLPMKRDDDGTLRIFDPATGAFAAYNRDGTTKTYFKPGSRDYFARQPGASVKPRDLPPP